MRTILFLSGTALIAAGLAAACGDSGAELRALGGAGGEGGMTGIIVATGGRVGNSGGSTSSSGGALNAGGAGGDTGSASGGSTAASCTGTPVACDGLTKADCSAAGCAWSFCSGDAGCEDLTASNACKSTADALTCAWTNNACGGTPPACSSYLDESACTQASGCSWTP